MNKLQKTFLNDDIISLVLLLQEGASEEVANYVALQIINYDQNQKSTSANHFTQKLLEGTGQQQAVHFYQSKLQYITSMNQLYKVLLTTLKDLRHQKSSRIEQGSVIDLFTRRTLITLSKMEFKDILTLWIDFEKFKVSTTNPKYDQFTLDLIVKELSDTLLYNKSQISYDDLNTLLDDVMECTSDIKISFLKALNHARALHPFKAIKQLRRFFDQPMRLHLSESNQRESLSSLQMVAVNMTMGFDDECLLNLSEALRLSQTQSDEENINQCLIFLYQIAYRLGNFKEQLILMEYAINHSLKLQNPLYFIQNCLNYWISLRYNHTFLDDQSILSKKHIAWIDALHHQIKKIFNVFDSSNLLKQQNITKLLHYPLVSYQITIALLQSSYGYIEQLNILLKRYDYYINDQIALLQFEACEILINHKPQQTLLIMQRVASSMIILPIEIQASILLINMKLLNIRGDTTSAAYLLENNQDLISKLAPSQKAKLCKEKSKTKFVLIKAQNILEQIQVAQDQGQSIQALAYITELQAFAVQEKLQEYVVLSQIYGNFILLQDGQSDEVVHKIRDIYLQGINNYSLQTRSLIWYLDAQVQIKQSHLHLAISKLETSINLAKQICDFNHMKKCYFQLSSLYSDQQIIGKRDEASIQYCKCEAAIQSYQSYKWIRFLEPIQLLSLQYKIISKINDFI